MKTYPNPEYLILHKIRQVREKYPDLPELAALEDEVLDIINVTTVENLRASAIQAAIIPPEDLTDKSRQKIDQVLVVARRYLHMEWDDELTDKPEPEGK